MDTRNPYKATAGVAEALLLEGSGRYRNSVDDDDSSEVLPFLGGEEDAQQRPRPPPRPRPQKRTWRWDWRRPSRYQPVDGGQHDDDDDGGIAQSDAETDIEEAAGIGARDDGVRDDDDDSDSGPTKNRDDKDRRIPGAAWYQAQRPGSVIALVAMLLFFLVFAATLALVPMMRLVEDAICRRYYGVGYGEDGHDGNSTAAATSAYNIHNQFIEDDRGSGGGGTDERLCKVDAVQAELAWLGGVAAVTQSIFGLITSFPWALLSDRVGRKPIFRIAFLGAALSFGWTSVLLLHRDVLSVWWVLTSQVLLVVGGGADVAVTILHSIVVDVLVTDRASGFIWLAMGAVAGSIVGPACAAMLMSSGGEGGGSSAWLPIGLTLFVLAPMVLILTIFLPETLPKAIPKKMQIPPTQLEGLPSPAKTASSSSFWTETIPAHMRETLVRLRETVAVLRRSRAALLLLPTFLFQPAMQGVQGGILAQSVSKRFGWSLAQTGYLFSFRGLVTVLVLGLIPAVSKYVLVGTTSTTTSTLKTPPKIQRRCWRCSGLRLSETSKDLLLARASLVCLLIGNVLMAASASLAVLVSGLVLSTLAVGLTSMTRSLITYFFLKEAEAAGEATAEEEADSSSPDGHTSRLYTLTGMVETVGSVLAGPLLAWTFSSGLSLGGGWIGLPFYYVAGLCVAALACLLLIDGGSGGATLETGGGQVRLSTTDGREAGGGIAEEGEVGGGRIVLP